jgi:hypothetical protein
VLLLLLELIQAQLTLDLRDQVPKSLKSLLLLMSPLEVGVAETLLVRVVTCLVEVVHVQLPHEG